MTNQEYYFKWLNATTDKERYANVLAYMDKLDKQTRNVIKPLLPHGSGIDYQWICEVLYKRVSKFHYEPYAIHCHNAIHAMNENGYYDGNVPFTVVFPFDGTTINVQDFQLVAHNWKSYTTKKYWPCYVDYVAQSVTYCVPNNMEVLQ